MLTKYDYESFMRGNWAYGGVFDEIGALNINHETTYAEAGFYDLWRMENGRAIHCWYYIRIDQNGLSLHISKVIPKKRCIEICEKIMPDAAAKMAELWQELKKYQFEPIGYEIRDGERYYLKSEDEAKTSNIIKMGE